MRQKSSFAEKVMLVVVFLVALVVPKSFSRTANDLSQLTGAWQHAEGTVEQSLLIADGYCMLTEYDKVNKKYLHSFGGPITASDKQITIKVEFNSSDKAAVGKTLKSEFSIRSNTLNSNIGGAKVKWTRVDDGKSALAGNWRITQRRQEGKMAELPLRARRTLKLLTGTRFQWAAINIETGEFSGTGGGTYTFADGKYTEHIEFFSRDSSRVGAMLTFDGKVENGDWIHSGLSSRGDPIYEIWSRMK